jgi:hypothetical protein
MQYSWQIVCVVSPIWSTLGSDLETHGSSAVLSNLGGRGAGMTQFEVNGKLVQGVDLLRRCHWALHLDLWPFLMLYPPDWLPVLFHHESSRALTFAERLFRCLYTRNIGCMSGCKISHFDAIYLHLHIRQKWSYLAGQARVGLNVRAQ